MIRYHGSPITPLDAAYAVWRGKHGMVSFANPEQISLLAEVSQSWTIDNGAYSFWGQGTPYPFEAFMDFCYQWRDHPGLDWIVAPDVIGGSEDENDALLEKFIDQRPVPIPFIVPVWHLDESVPRLVDLSNHYDRIALGSAGEYELGTPEWWGRIGQAMDAICEDGKPRVKLHGLRMMNPALFGKIPFASVDSTNVAQNLGAPRWNSPYQPLTKTARAITLADRIENSPAATVWKGNGVQLEIWESAKDDEPELPLLRSGHGDPR